MHICVHLHLISNFASTDVDLDEYDSWMATHFSPLLCLSLLVGICTTEVADQVLGLSGSVLFVCACIEGSSWSSRNHLSCAGGFPYCETHFTTAGVPALTVMLWPGMIVDVSYSNLGRWGGTLTTSRIGWLVSASWVVKSLAVTWHSQRPSSNSSVADRTHSEQSPCTAWWIIEPLAHSYFFG